MKTTISKRKFDLTEKPTSVKSAAPLAGQIVKSQLSDSLFIGSGEGGLLEWSVRQRKVIKNYGNIMTDGISTLRTTPDKK